jgi:hypothetical protein
MKPEGSGPGAERIKAVSLRLEVRAMADRGAVPVLQFVNGIAA